MNRYTIRQMQPALHACAEHFAVHGFNGMTPGKIAAVAVKIELLQKAIKDLHDELKDDEATDAVYELMEPTRKIDRKDFDDDMN